MNINIKATSLDLTPAINEYISEKLGSLSRFLKAYEKQGEIEANIEIARSTKHHRHGDVYRAEITVFLPGKKLRAEHSDWDIRVSIDNINKKIKEEIKKYKELKNASIKKKSK